MEADANRLEMGSTIWIGQSSKRKEVPPLISDFKEFRTFRSQIQRLDRCPKRPHRAVSPSQSRLNLQILRQIWWSQPDRVSVETWLLLTKLERVVRGRHIVQTQMSCLRPPNLTANVRGRTEPAKSRKRPNCLEVFLPRIHHLATS